MSDASWGQGPTQFFYQLDGQAIFTCLERLGLRPTGTLMGLNSFENRVYELGIEPHPLTGSDSSVVAKFYRPGRWSQQQILEEHEFLFQLQAVEIPVIAPLVFAGESLHFDPVTSLYFVLFPRRGGRAPQDLNEERAARLGRLIGRTHLVGQSRSATHRLQYTPQVIGGGAIENIKQSLIVPTLWLPAVVTAAEELCQSLALKWAQLPLQRIHGDLHPGNILERDQDLWILDFDDLVVGPQAQDFWMLLPPAGEGEDLFPAFAEGYETFLPFPWEQLSLIPALRALRLLHFHGWVSKRWSDPAFPLAFSQYQESATWEQLYYQLKQVF